jgi:hypothetical protein
MADTLEMEETSSAAVQPNELGLPSESYAPDGRNSAPRTPRLGVHARVLIGSAASQLPIWGTYQYHLLMVPRQVKCLTLPTSQVSP